MVVTAAAAVVPAFMPGAGADGGRAFELVLLLPTAMAAFLVLAAVSAGASGGGRELLARDPAQIHPVSPTTDHLGALLLAPLNIAWLLQAWMLLGVTAYALGTTSLAQAQIVMLLWLAAATAVAQVLAWSLEGYAGSSTASQGCGYCWSRSSRAHWCCRWPTPWCRCWTGSRRPGWSSACSTTGPGAGRSRRW